MAGEKPIHTELEILVPTNYVAERSYIIDVLVSRFLGLSYRLTTNVSGDEVIIQRQDKKIILKEVLFKLPDHKWLSDESLPAMPLEALDTLTLAFQVKTVARYLPIIYGRPIITTSATTIEIEVDILGSSFFMLSRYEEYVVAKEDEFGRFPAAESVASKAKFLQRPIVNEYTELLWAAIKILWPEIERKPRTYRVIPTHDVDRPFAYANVSYPTILKRFFEGACLRHEYLRAINRLKRSIVSKITNGREDPYNTFEYLMQQSEKRGLISEFYFLTQTTNRKKDADYSLQDEPIRKLLQDIYKRNHTIGLHPSYDSYMSAKQTQREAQVLKEACRQLGIEQNQWGGRQHYLRWKTPTTAGNWETARMDYDSTLYFAEAPGFRSGCCYQHPIFDLQRRATLHLVERPLIFMDASICDTTYVGLSSAQRRELIITLKSNCRAFDGLFTVLWHNSNLETKEMRHLYEFTLDS